MEFFQEKEKKAKFIFFSVLKPLAAWLELKEKESQHTRH
jgi:hypothetical protein